MWSQGGESLVTSTTSEEFGSSRGAERGCYLRPSASGLALLHLLLGGLGLFWIAE